MLVSPDEESLARALGIQAPSLESFFDVIVLGAGPAGLTAAIYCARERLKTLLLDSAGAGGQAALTAHIENYPGFPEAVSGADLMARIVRQARKFGAVLQEFEEVASITVNPSLFAVQTGKESYRSRTVIVALGSKYRTLGVPGEAEFLGKGVSFCATCDAPLYRGAPVVVVGGGNSALQEAIHLQQFASQLTVLQDLDHLTGSRLLQDRVGSLPNVRVMKAHRLTRILGTEAVEAVEALDLGTGKTEVVPCLGVFVFIGMEPNTGCVRGLLDLDSSGFIVTDPTTLETSVKGIFAAGDVRAGSHKQLTSAVGEGTVASFMAQKWISKSRTAHKSG